VSGRGALTREKKLELDVRYVEQCSIRLDAAILAATVAQVFGRSNIYEKEYSQIERTRGETKSTQKDSDRQAE
jgi:hypothetical protein